MVVGVDRPTMDEVRAFQHGRVRVRLLTADHTLLFVLRLGDLPWVDAPYSPHRVASEARVTPGEPADGYGWPLIIVLADSTTGIVHVIRWGTLSTRFSRAVWTAYERVAAVPADDPAHVAEVVRFQRRTPGQLAEQAVVRYEHGEEKN